MPQLFSLMISGDTTPTGTMAVVAPYDQSLIATVETCGTDAGEVIPMGINAASSGKQAFTTAEPIGVVVAVSAFNHPLNLIAHQVGPAVAAGCPVIVKPAEDTPLSCFRLVAILHQAGLPTEWCQALMPDSLEVTTKLVTDSRLGFLSFIGSARVGWMPFAGLRQSGLGVGGIPHTLHDMQIKKMVVMARC